MRSWQTPEYDVREAAGRAAGARGPRRSAGRRSAGAGGRRPGRPGGRTPRLLPVVIRVDVGEARDVLDWQAGPEVTSGEGCH